MAKRAAGAFDAWSAQHRRSATLLGVGALAALVVAGLLLTDRSLGFSLIIGGFVALTILAVLGIASLITGNPVSFSVLNSGQSSTGDLSAAGSLTTGDTGGPGGGGLGGIDGGGGGGSS